MLSSSDEATELRGSKREVRKEQLLDVATHLFSKYGLEGTTTKDIAREAGVSPGLLYHYYTSKEELLVDVVVRFGDGSNFENRFEDLSKLPFLEGFPKILSRLSSIIEEHKEVIWLVMRAAARFPAVDAALRSFNKRGDTILSNYFQSKIDSGEILPFDVEQASAVVCHCITMERIFWADRFQDISSLANVFLYGVLPRSSQPAPVAFSKEV